jgi:hypothetical protein
MPQIGLSVVLYLPNIVLIMFKNKKRIISNFIFSILGGDTGYYFYNVNIKKRLIKYVRE